MLVLKYVVTIHIQKQYLRVRWAWTEFCSLFVFTTFFIKRIDYGILTRPGVSCVLLSDTGVLGYDPQPWVSRPHRIYRNAKLCPVCHLENRKKWQRTMWGTSVVCYYVFLIFPLVIHLYHLSHEIHDSKSHPWRINFSFVKIYFYVNILLWRLL